MLNFLICGIGGKMGANLVSLLSGDQQAKVACGVDVKSGEMYGVPVFASFKDVNIKVDAVIDFSSPAVLDDEIAFCTKNCIPLVIGSTGYTQEQLQKIKDASSKTAVFKTANFSLGVNLMVELVKKAAKVLGEDFDIEIIERHHNQKVDAPSGTALMLADAANEVFEDKKPYVDGRSGQTGKRGREIGIHAVRGGTIVGEHEIMFAGEDEIISISHSARSKRVFAAGAIKAAKWIAGKKCGFFDMKDVLQNIIQ